MRSRKRVDSYQSWVLPQCFDSWASEVLRYLGGFNINRGAVFRAPIRFRFLILLAALSVNAVANELPFTRELDLIYHKHDAVL